MKYANGEKGVGVHDTISFRIIWRYNNKQIRDAYSTFTSAQRNKKKIINYFYLHQRLSFNDTLITV